MTSLLNTQRPPVFCPGCLHERVVQVLDQAFQSLGLISRQVAIVTDIGCSGLFDTFFNTHALHGLHGRALTYATGIKLSRPELTVVVIMGDGGLGIGGAHVLSSCRRNLDINLLILNNFNYGMTGGQCSATTPSEASTSSGFLNQLDSPLDICRVASAAGAPWVDRIMATDKSIADRLAEAIRYEGFTLTDIWGVCPGRFSKRNRKPLSRLEHELKALPPFSGRVTVNERAEYGQHYRQCAAQMPGCAPPLEVKAIHPAPGIDKRSVLLLGAAGQRINTAGEILCIAAMSGGMHVTQKNDYPITVLRGHSVSEVILSRTPVGYTGIAKPDIILALAPEGIARRRKAFTEMDERGLIIAPNDLEIPATRGRIIRIDVKQLGIPPHSYALASLARIAKEHEVITPEMLETSIRLRFNAEQCEKALTMIEDCRSIP